MAIFQQLCLRQENPIEFVSDLPVIVAPREPVLEVLMPTLKKSKAERRTERPRIPGYGISKSKTGMLPWEWAVKTLTDSREYWIVTVRSDGRPHAMIIWGLRFEGAFWFGTGSKTQKARNLAKNPNCIVGTQNAAEAVILEGVAELITDPALGKKLEPSSLSKYGMSGGDPSEPLYRVRPSRVFGLIEKSFPKTATRWTFD
jgi:general stress protein 26